jgi:hypothetical protein
MEVPYFTGVYSELELILLTLAEMLSEGLAETFSIILSNSLKKSVL